MHRTTLVLSSRKDLCDGTAHAEALISDNQSYTIKAAFFQPYKEAFPAFGILLHALRRTYDLTVSILVYSYGNKDADIFKLSTPVALEVNTVYIDI